MSCECAVCALQLDFQIDDHLLEEIENGRCVVFAGAGISTETSGAHSFSFYDQIAEQIGKSGCELSFPELIDAYEARPNGRQKLIDQILSRFEYIDSWRDLRQAATKFHRELATAPYFQSVVTTNWDRYFEEIMGATPFVYESDIAFWESSPRPLLKIHGSIDNFSTLVASSEDYSSCEERLKTGRLGDLLRQIFATKTVIFVGYSATDSDFLNIYKSVMGSMGRLARAHYLVSPFMTEEQALKFKKLNISTIVTDASYFVKTVKLHMSEKFCYCHDESYLFVQERLNEVYETHFRFTDSFNVFEQPHLIFCTAYQDGLIHGFQRIIDRRSSNNYTDLHRLRGQIGLYHDKIIEYVKQKDYWNSSYFSGYQMALIYFYEVNRQLDSKTDNLDSLEDLPKFYHPRLDIMDEAEFDEKVRPHPEIHKAALKQARRMAKGYENAESMVVQHTPFG